MYFEIGQKAVKSIMHKPHGTFFVDLKADVEDRPHVTEINAGRFGTTIHFYTEAGFNFPYALVQNAFDEFDDTKTFINPIKANTYWIRTLDCGPALVENI